MIRYRKLTVTSNRGITLCHKVVPVISHVLSSTYYWWLYMHISRKQEKKVVTFFILIILIDIQNICSINSRALAVGLMAYGHIGSQFIRLHINMDSLKCTSFLWSLQRHRSCVRPLTPPVDWGRGYKTIVVLRLFDYSPLLTRKIAVDKQENSERAVTFPLLKNT